MQPSYSAGQTNEPYYTVTCGLSDCSTSFLHYLKNETIFEKKLLNINRAFWFSQQFCLKHFSFQEELSEILSQMYIGLLVKYPLFLSDLN